MLLSVVICTYNPKPEILEKVLDGLQAQGFEKSRWELIIVDNNSSQPVSGGVNLAWHPNNKIVVERRAGLSHARVAGINSAIGSLIVFVDDDNILEEAYLETAWSFYNKHPEVGCFGGLSIAVFETTPPSWLHETGINLGCQDYGSEVYISNYKDKKFRVSSYPEKAPIGTGMVIQKKAFQSYLAEAETNPERMALGRKGKSLSSGEDNDIILSVVKAGYEIAYVPGLVVQHMIPANRYSYPYLKKMAFESNRSWVTVLQVHGINPHRKILKWTLLPRKLKSYLSHKAWRSPLSAVKWQSSCGLFTGLSEL